VRGPESACAAHFDRFLRRGEEGKRGKKERREEDTK